MVCRKQIARTCFCRAARRQPKSRAQGKNLEDACIDRDSAVADAASNARALATLPHDARTPLQSIKLRLELLESQESSFLSGEQCRRVDKIDDLIDHLADLMDAVLTMTRLREQSLSAKLEHVDLNALATTCSSILEVQSRQRGVQLAVDVGGLAVLADASMLRQVLLDMLVNALRHTPPNSQVTLRARQVSERVRFDIIDQGPGLQTQDVDAVFEPFVRGQNSGNAGLGLSIARDLVRLMRGHIDASDAPEGGAMFSLWLCPSE